MSDVPESSVPPGPRRDSDATAHGEDSGSLVDLLPLWFERGLVVVTAAVLSFGGFGLLLAVIGVYHILPVLVVGAVLTSLASALAWPRRSEHSPNNHRLSRGIRYPAIGMCVMALAFAIWNGSDAAHHVAVGRDPGVYAVTGKWIATHGNLIVPAGIPITARAAGATTVLPGTYAAPGNQLEFQFNHLLPVLLAEADNVGGDRLLFRVPALLGAFALCAVYAAGCRFVRRPWLVLAAVGALALSLPQLNVSRDTFSESSVELLLWSGLCLTLIAYRRRRFGMAVLAGAALGGTMLSRVDAFVYLIPLPMLGALAVLAAGSRVNRRQLWKLYLGLFMGAVPFAALGTFDVVERAGHYYADLGLQIHQMQLAMIGSVLVSVALLAIWPRLAPRKSPIINWISAHRQGLSIGSAITVALGGLAAWLLRPVVLHGHGMAIPLVGGLQAQAGLPVDPGRTYAEYSISWISWYIGPITVTLAIIGAALVVARMWRRIDAASALLVSVTGLASAVYLWNPSIVPDQIWAMRRFVPATLPLLVLLAAVAVAALERLIATSRAGAAWQRPVVTVGAAGMLVFPLATTLPVANFSPQTGVLTVVQAVCKTVGPHSAVAIPTNDPSGLALTDAVRTWCNVPVTLLTHPQSRTEIQQIARSWRATGRTLWVVGSSAAATAQVAPETQVKMVASAASPHELEMTIQRAPQSYVLNVMTMYAGSVLAP